MMYYVKLAKEGSGYKGFNKTIHKVNKNKVYNYGEATLCGLFILYYDLKATKAEFEGENGCKRCKRKLKQLKKK